jgi:mono/diheme cytochrome c family protein
MKARVRAFLPVVVVAGGLAPVPLVRGSEKSGPAQAQTGAATYRTHCAPCHGATGEGGGPLAPRLRITPPDLTKLSRRSDGKYPFDKVYRIVDGRDPVPGHGSGDMPIWGDAFLDSREGYSQERVKEKITQLVQYLASIQARQTSSTMQAQP